MLISIKEKQGKPQIIRNLFFFLILSFIICFSSYAGSVSLGWDVNADADYYIVYWGLSAENPSYYSGNIGPTTSYTAVVPDDNEYYFAVKAFNSCGNSSDFSDWITATATNGGGGTPLPIPGTTPGTTPAPGPTPETLSNVITDADNYPLIEVFNKNFEHLEWLMTGWPAYNDLGGVAHVATGDISNNGENEIIIGLGPVETEGSIPGGYFEVVGDNYSHLAWGRVQWSEYNIINGETWPTCGDVDGDGIDEIIVGLGVGGQGYFEVFKYNEGEVVHFGWGQVEWNEYNSLIGETRPVCADIDGDGADEIIVGLGSKGGHSDIPGGRFEVFDNDLTHLSWAYVNWSEYNSVNGETWPAPGDMDGDGNIEIVVGLGVGGGGRMALFDFTTGEWLQSEWINVEWNEYNSISGETRPVCGDIDNDLKDEIIVGFGSVAEGIDIPEGFFTVIDDDFTMMEWGQINNAEFNKINGESIPSKGNVTDNDKVIIGLGSWDFNKDSDNIFNDNEKAASASEGCFINSLL